MNEQNETNKNSAQPQDRPFTRKEVYELFEKSDHPTVTIALQKLGYNDSTQEYPTNIVVLVERVLKGTGVAVQKHKMLTGDVPVSENEASIVVQETTAIAAEILDSENISIPTEVLFAVAQSIITQSRKEAAMLASLQEKTFVAALKERNNKFAGKLLKAIGEQRQASESLLSEDNIQKMVDLAVPKQEVQFDVDAFLSEVKEDIRSQDIRDRQHQNLGEQRAAAKTEFNVDSFLKEVWG